MLWPQWRARTCRCPARGQHVLEFGWEHQASCSHDSWQQVDVSRAQQGTEALSVMQRCKLHGGQILACLAQGAEHWPVDAHQECGVVVVLSNR